MADNKKLLVERAIKAMRQSHAPYSGFRVGAAIIGTSGRVFQGCNIESSSYSLTICAERTAIFKAISEGERNFKAIAVVSSAGSETPPCGACRQVLWDLAGNIDVVLSTRSSKIRSVKLKSLLPIAFDSKVLRRRDKRRK